MAKRKKKSDREKLKDKLNMAWKRIIKLRDNYTCQYCCKQATGAGMHASHVIPKSSGIRLRWDINNGKALCFYHHRQCWHMDPTEFGPWFISKFPKRWKYLQEQKLLGKAKYTNEDLESMLEKLTSILKEMEKV